ncbi:MAG: SAM-dependent methyltransferase, partial [Thioalkalivibrio sp.]|nr:SAM-dependent methyltransferase [Thioalkalivibrio sp.]
PERWGHHVGGRKWRQIVAFAARVQVASGQSVVEWCAGKGHLARTLAHSHGTPVTALESDARFCREGQVLAERQGVSLHLHEQDVLAPDVLRWLHPSAHVVALHACGDLHLRLLDLAAQTGCAISLVPCCYHRTVHERYQPLSQTGRELAVRHALVLTRQDLALAVQETVTAPFHMQRQRRRAKAWRLGFDLLQRELRGVDAYLPVPRLRYGALPADYQGFCRWAAAEKRLALPSGIDWKTGECTGWARLEEVERLEQVRHLFRRPLEVWLALDRARLLDEAGMRVDLGSFCDRAVTPRNLLLRASRE